MGIWQQVDRNHCLWGVGRGSGTQNEVKFNTVQSLLFLAFCIVVISYGVSYLHVVYVVRFSKNMLEVESYLKKAKKHPYYASLVHIINRVFQEAQKTLLISLDQGFPCETRHPHPKHIDILYI